MFLVAVGLLVYSIITRPKTAEQRAEAEKSSVMTTSTTQTMKPQTPATMPHKTIAPQPKIPVRTRPLDELSHLIHQCRIINFPPHHP